jgi:Leucine-rich repeat (LRR) protein
MRRTLALGLVLAAALSAEVTLQEYARGKTLTVYTVGEGAPPPLVAGDQSNNFKPGDKVVSLSRLGLSSLDGIASLRVMDGDRAVPLAAVKRLQLYLNYNALTRLPAEFFTLQNVAFVYLYHNRLDAIPPQMAQMKGLQGMYFTGNNISRIPPEVFTMTWLRKLQVSKTHLTELPPEIGNLTELIHLNLSNNQIVVVPETIGRLKLLRVCDLSNNPIRRLPESFGKVPIMHQLRVRDTLLTELPAGFAAMPGSIDITGSGIRLASLSPGLRARISREKR